MPLGVTVVRSPEAGRLAGVLDDAGFAVTPDGDGLVTVAGTTPAAVGARAFAAGIELHELRAQTSDLEDLYFGLTAGQEQFAASTPGTGSSPSSSSSTTCGDASR